MRNYLNLFFCLLVFTCLIFETQLNGQELMKYKPTTGEIVPDWVNEMYQENPNPETVIKLYHTYYQTHEFVKNQHTQYYKRWLRSISRERIRTKEEDRLYIDQLQKNKSSRNNQNNWTSLGPYDWDHSAAGRSYAPGSAHVYTVEQSISNPDVIYAGTATSGLWKSTDRGLNWLPLTESMLQSTIYAIEIDHSNAEIIYASLQNSIFKSTDGGTQFFPTGNASFQNLDLDVKDIRMLPGNSNIVFACTNVGLFRTANAGSTWTNVASGDFQEVEIHPSNTSIIYAVRKIGIRTEFFKSSNTGISFSQTGNNWPIPPAGGHQERTEIAVSPANPNYVYAHCSGAANGGSGLYGVYISTDQGVNWNFQCCGPQPAGPPSLSNPNLMGWSDDGTDDGGQYYYDMGFAVSPTNSDTILLAGVNLWVSGNGGATFSCPAKWSHSYKPNYVHADIHDVNYYAHSGEIWIACDGGIFYSSDNGVNYQRRNVGITGTDFWGYGQGWWYGDVMLGGAYHNGTLLKEENVYINDWLCTDGGDGTMGFVNPGIDRQVYSQYDIKSLQSNRNISPITRPFQNKPNNTYIIGKSNDLLIDPRYYTHWMTGSGTKLFKTEDNGYTFTELYNFGVDVAAMEQCWSNPDVIYVCTYPDWWALKRIFRSDNGGTSWTEITPSSSMVNGNVWIPYDIVVDHHDPMKVWIARTSMYDSNINGYSVFYSSNGGQTWQNISGIGLNGHSPTSMFLQKGTDHGIYIGTRSAVFYKDDNLNDWVLYNDGLPAQTHSTKLEGYYRKQKIRNATNRSVWESNFYTQSTPLAFPSSNISVLNCTRDTVYFVDHSVVSDQNVSWQWSFPGAIPSSSTLRNPKVTYTEDGVYDVTLTVSDVYGTSTKTIQNMITVNNQCKVDTIPGKALRAVAPNKHGIVPNANFGLVNELTITAWVKPTGIQPDYSAIFMGDGEHATGLNFKDGNNKLAYHWPGGQWWWNSNIIVPANEWSFVAMVVRPTGITVYCNEQSATHNFNLEAADIPSFRLGSYRNWDSRNMNGLIDEVAIYNRPLSTNEIRTLRHLTKKPVEDSTLIAYYQFNSDEIHDYDKVGERHVLLSNNATKVLSGIPVGSGHATRMLVNSGGEKDFGLADVKMYFPNSGIYPNGDIVVTKIHLTPDLPPDGILLPNAYWVVNNYGTNQNFTFLDSIRFYNVSNIAGGCSPEFFVYHKRTQHAQGATWGNPVDVGDNYQSNFPQRDFVTFGAGNSIRNMGQFIMMRNNTSGNPNVQEVCNGYDDDCDGLVDEEYALEVSNANDNGTNTLRAILNCAQAGDTITFSVNIDTIQLFSPLEVNKNVYVVDENGNRVVLTGDLSLSGFEGKNFFIKVNDGVTVKFENIKILHFGNIDQLPALLNYGNLTFVNCSIIGQPATIIKNEGQAVFTSEGVIEIK